MSSLWRNLLVSLWRNPLSILVSCLWRNLVSGSCLDASLLRTMLSVPWCLVLIKELWGLLMLPYLLMLILMPLIILSPRLMLTELWKILLLWLLLLVVLGCQVPPMVG